MCWTTYKKENLQKKTAKKDISVIKILLKTEDGALISPYRFTEYLLDKVYWSEIGQPIENLGHDMWVIYEGLHSYSPSGISLAADIDSCTIRITPRNDAANLLDYWYQFAGAVIFEGVIPSGSKYYENENGELVSDGLKIVSVIAEIDSDLVFSTDKLQSLNERMHNL